MSFRLFIYYCAVCGACAAYLGWALGRLAGGADPVIQAGVKGMSLGMWVALGLSLVDALWNMSPTRLGQIALRVVLAGVLGSVGGLVGGIIGQALYGWLRWGLFLILGWAITGLLIGASLGAFDVVASVTRQEDIRGARRKIRHGILGGTIGGALGGVLFLLLKASWSGIFQNQSADELWTPSASGFVALGACMGLAIGLAQVILKEAWVRVEQGFRAGRELILSKAETTIGRAESSDIGLFGDAAVERRHARILTQADRYVLIDAGSAGGTFLNGERIHDPTPLGAGDEIRVGNSILSFGERRKRSGLESVNEE